MNTPMGTMPADLRSRAARPVLLALACVLFAPAPARAQDAALDDKLRDLLHQTTAQLRAAEDNAATLQTQLDDMTHQRDQLQQQIAARPAAPVVAPQQQAQLQQAQAGLLAARAQNAQLAAAAGRLQTAYTQAAGVARDKDAADRQHAAGLQSAAAALDVCKRANAKLIDLSGEILHLYETPKFNMLLVTNHERLLGFKRVELQNLVQDYDDRIAAQAYIAPDQGGH